MDSIDNPDDVTDEIRESRVAFLEKAYERTKNNIENENRMHKVHDKIACILGSEDMWLLREYTDRLIACFNIEVDWYYDKGFSDAQDIMRRAAAKAATKIDTETPEKDVTDTEEEEETVGESAE